MAKKKRNSKRDAEWAEAKRLCRLSAEDVRKAKELGLNPRKLIKNRPNPSEPWKQPVHLRVRELYAKTQEKQARKQTGPTPAEDAQPPDRTGVAFEGEAGRGGDDEEPIPF